VEILELGRGASDERFISYLGEEDGYLITCDVAIARAPHLRAALVEAGIGAFFFAGRPDRNLLMWVELAVRRWVDITAYAHNNERPFLCGVPDRGVLRRLRVATRR